MTRRSYSYQTKAPSQRPMKAVQSRKTSGLFTARGKPIYNAEAYASTGAPAFNAYGKRIYKPASYESTVRENSMLDTAAAAQSLNQNAKAFTYVVQMEGGKKYAGFTRDPEVRLERHLLGREFGGASATEGQKIQQIKITPHYTVESAKRAETKTYYELKDKHGVDQVRGAGHTRKFDY